MTRMRRFAVALPIAVSLLGASLTAAKPAQACGGCFAPVDSPQVVTDHRMVLAIHPDETILWDQIKYTGAPEDFSWVLPVSGDVRVELGSSEFFEQLDSSTAVRVIGPTLTPCSNSRGGFGAPSASFADAGAASDSSVQVIHQETVGPYDTVTLRSTDTMALADWLRSNSYVIPSAIQPVIDWYVQRHMDFVALRLHPGQGIQSMQPVRIRYATASMVLPLRMVAAGVADKVGITLWVFGHGRHESQNFGNATIDQRDLAWNWTTSTSNYRDVFRDTQAATSNGRSWITEFANSSDSIRYSFYEPFNPGGFDAGPPDVPVVDASDDADDAGDADPNDAGDPSDAAPVDPPVEPPTSVSDFALATHQYDPNVWVTRIRTDLSSRFLDSDLVLQPSLDTEPVSNTLYTTQEIGPRPARSCGSDVVYGTSTGSGVMCAARPWESGRARDAALVLAALATAAAVIRRKRSANAKS